MIDPGVRVKQAIKSKPGVRECCKRPGTLKKLDMPGDSTILVCMVCGAKHYHMLAETGKLGLKL